MKKTRLILGCLVVLAALAGLTGCMVPDNGLRFSMYPENTGTGYTTTNITCTITNTGYKDVENVMVLVDITFEDNNTHALRNPDPRWSTMVYSIPSGDSRDVTVSFAKDTNELVLGDPRVIEVLWDQN